MTAADGAGGWRRYEIDVIQPGRLHLVARGERGRDPELVPGVALAVALTKAGALDTVVARCTELGVTRITPVRARRCVVRWDAAQAERAVARLRTVAARSRRAVPAGAAARDRRRRGPGRLRGPARRGRRRSGGGSIDDLPAAGGGAWTVVVGPEGGLDPGRARRPSPAPRD